MSNEYKYKYSQEVVSQKTTSVQVEIVSQNAT